MKDERILMCVVFGAFFLRELWTLFPDRQDLRPFPFSEQEINLRTYIWMLSGYFIQIVLAYALFAYSDHAKLFFNAMFILAVLETLEFCLNYNEYWIKIAGIGLNVTMVRYPVLFITGLWNIVTWKT